MKNKSNNPKKRTYTDKLKLVRTKFQTMFVMTPENIKELGEVAGYLKVRDIADYFGIHVDTLYEIFRRQPDAYRTYVQAKARLKLRYAKRLEESSDGNKDINVNAVMFYLRTRCGYTETSRPCDVSPVNLWASDNEEEVDLQEIAEFKEWRKQKLLSKV